MTDLPFRVDEWSGEWTIGGKVIARYHIGSADYGGEVDDDDDDDEQNEDAE